MRVFFHKDKTKKERKKEGRESWFHPAASPGSLSPTLSQIKDVNFILKHTLIRAITCLVKTPIKMLITILALQMNSLRFIILL